MLIRGTMSQGCRSSQMPHWEAVAMAGRKKYLPKDAKVVALSLGACERVALSVIEARRHIRGEGAATASQIVTDALWHYLAAAENLTREAVERLLPVVQGDPTNVRVFPKKGASQPQ
jgi:hypothetical protein